MIIGMILRALGGVSYYSPTFGRGGASATFFVECFAVDSGASLAVTVQHKNVEETAWSSAGSFGAITAAGITSLSVSDVKEQVRFRYVLTGSAATDTIYINVPPPSWRPY